MALAAILFDMDGTLVDTEPFWYRVELEVTEAMGSPWHPSDQAACLGQDLVLSAQYMLRVAEERLGRPGSLGSGPATVDEVIEACIDGMVRMLETEDLLILPGVLDIIRAARSRGIPVGLVTASWRRLVDPVAKRMQEALGETAFEVTVAGDDVERNKPHPDPYLKAMAELGVRAEECIVFEDSRNGVAAGLASGATVVAIPHLVSIEAESDRLHIVKTLAGLTLADLEGYLTSR